MRNLHVQCADVEATERTVISGDCKKCTLCVCVCVYVCVCVNVIAYDDRCVCVSVCYCL